MTSNALQAPAQTTSPRGRLLTLFVLFLLVGGVALFWSLALVEGMRPIPPSILVRAPEDGQVEGPYPVQVLAFDSLNKKRVPLEGHVGFVGDKPVMLRDHIATLVIPSNMGNTATHNPPAHVLNTAELRVEVKADGIPIGFNIPVELSASKTSGQLPRWSAWSSALAAPSPDDLAADPVYPLFGKVRSSLASDVLLLRNHIVTRESLAPHAAYARLQDGRALALDRSGVTLSAPTFLRPGASVPLQIQASGDSKRLLSLFVAGQIQSVKPIQLRTGENPVSVDIPSEAPPNAVFEVHLSVSLLNPKSASAAIGMLWEDPSVFEAGPLQEKRAARLRATPLFNGISDPLLEGLLTGQITQTPEIWQGIFGRFRSGLRFPGRVGPSAEEQQLRAHRIRIERSADFRRPFRVCALLLAALLGAIAWRVGQKRRALDELLHQEWVSDEDKQDALPSPWHRFGGALWAALGLIASFAAMGALDWALHFVLLME